MTQPSWNWWLLMLMCTGTVIYSLVAYGLMPQGSTVHPDMRAVYAAHPWGISLHVFGSAIALLLGPWQFHAGLRTRTPQLHRWLGRIYLLLGIGVGGISGFYMAQFAFGGLVSEVGFSMLAALWLVSGGCAYRAIRRGDIAGHKRWMLRCFALTFAAVTIRIYLGLFFASGLPFENFYPLLAWIGWVPNLVLVEWYMTDHNKSV